MSSYQVEIIDTQTGEMRLYTSGVDWNDENGGSQFWWAEGNMSCDCNRGMCFERAGGVPKEELTDWPCFFKRGVKNRFKVPAVILADGRRIQIDRR